MSSKTKDSAVAGGSLPEPERGGGFLAAWSALRLIMLVPVVATLVTGLALLIYGTIETWHFVEHLFFDPEVVTPSKAVLEAIEILDLFLLVTVMEVVAFGLYQLHFNQGLPVPAWLRVSSLDELKSKLIGVTVTVLAVTFLGEAVTADSGPNILYLGAGIGLVVVALTYFLSKIDPG